MIKKLLTVSISLAIMGGSAVVYAKGNAHEGKAQSSSCVACHGEGGNSMVPGFPKLAGQNESYLVRQIHAFKDGSRYGPMMAPLTLGLSPNTIENISAYYAEQKISANAMPVLESDDDEDEDDMDEAQLSEMGEQKQAKLDDLMALGSDLYRNGDLEREVSACIACHGPYGEGNKPAGFPALHAQHADYLIKSLNDYKKGVRQNNPDNMMHMIAIKMTDKEIKAVSYHISMMK